MSGTDGASRRNQERAGRFARIEFRESTGSTNDDALEHLGDPAWAGASIVAGVQSRGAGRKAGRRWIAAPGSALLVTTILPEAIPATALWAVPFWVGLCAADAVERVLGGTAPRLRWPNDLLLDGRKCGGILCVSRVTGERAWVACGVGINVRRPAELGELAGIDAAFLSDESPEANRDELLAALLLAYDARWSLLGRSEALIAAWERGAQLAGSTYRVRIDEDGEEFEGEALRLAPDGRLVLRVAGRERSITLADATVL